MTVALAVLIAVLCVTAGFLVAGAVVAFEDRRTERLLRSRIRSDVIVTLKSGDEFQGVLFEHDTRILVLRGAHQHLPQAVIPVDGELLIRWADVAYIQKP